MMFKIINTINAFFLFVCLHITYHTNIVQTLAKLHQHNQQKYDYYCRNNNISCFI